MNEKIKLKYITQILKQYKDSLGLLEKFHISEEMFRSYCKKIDEQRNIYREFVEYFNFNPGYNSSVEIGKGPLDTIIKNNENIISLYASMIDNLYEDSKLKICSGIPYIVNKHESIYNRDLKTFMTHNPYSFKQIDSWDDLVVSGGYNICVGVFGQNTDKDKKDKIEMLRNFANSIKTYVDEEQTTYDDMYLYIVKTNNKIYSKKYKY